MILYGDTLTISPKGVNTVSKKGTVVRLKDIESDFGIYPKPKAKNHPGDGSASPLTFQGNKKWRDDPDFMHKWFTRPFLTGKKPGNYMLPIKKKSKK